MNERLYRSRDDRMLAGVAGGLAELWDADPSLVRIVWALLVVFTGGLALLVYVVMAFVVPEDADLQVRRPAHTDPATQAASAASGAAEPGAASGWTTSTGTGDRAAERAARQAARAQGRSVTNRAGGNPGALIGGAILILIGGFFLAREFLPEMDFDWFWPLVLVGLGVFLLVSALRRGGDGPS